MTRKYFGTDGIRGTANQFPMTADMALKAAMATAIVLKDQNPNGGQNRVIIGKDTRLSCYMLEQAMASGFAAMGMETILLGPIPTPAVAILTKSLRADIGVMISASHNPFQDNGIKIFDHDGFKLPNETEIEIEKWIDSDGLYDRLPSSEKLGRAKRLDDATGRYVEYLKSIFPRGKSLQGLKVVIDCAHGAAYKAGPQVLWELEADVTSIGVKPNGININDKVGATATERLQKEVVEQNADIGIALDGDADRLIVVDEKGNRIDGDQVMAVLAHKAKADGWLRGNGVVATVMSNLGFERYLESEGLKLERTPVGDRYVVEAMREKGFNLGGEQSGHTVLSDFTTTGDGLMVALHILSILSESDEPASVVLKKFDPLPQILKNVRFKSGKPLEKDEVGQAISLAEKSLSGRGRVLVRASGTEPVIRVMAEGDDVDMVEKTVNDLCEAIEKAAS
ncbi:MAG: phosphoglucosamine mutase [Alphaproteobacteria bacterium]|nr:phosphoglucosamine mutase [Alphaproteobacteria bacterium]